MRKKSFLYLGVFALVGILLTGCKTGKNSSEEMTKVTLNEVAHSIFYAPQYVAIEEGYFKDAGIDFSKVDTKGLAEKVGDFFANIFNAIKDFFSGLFG